MSPIPDSGFPIPADGIQALELHRLAEAGMRLVPRATSTADEGPPAIVLRKPMPEPDDEDYRRWRRESVAPLADGFVRVTVRPPEEPRQLHALAKAAVLFADGRVRGNGQGLELRWVPVENLPALYGRLHGRAS